VLRRLDKRWKIDGELYIDRKLFIGIGQRMKGRDWGNCMLKILSVRGIG